MAVNEAIFSHLSKEDGDLFKALRGKMGELTILNAAVTLARNCIRESAIVDWQNVSPDLKIEACLESLAIGFLSGEIKRTAIEKLVR